MPEEADKNFSLEDFADNVLQAAQFTNLAPEAREQIKDLIVGEATARLGLMALAELNPEQIKQYEFLETTGDDARIFDFFANGIKDFPQKMALTLRAYAEEFVAEAQKTKRN